MKITEEEQEILYQLRMMALESQMQAEVAVHKSQTTKLDYENAVLKLYLKYGLQPTDRINEATGKIEKQEEGIDEQRSDNTDDERDG